MRRFACLLILSCVISCDARNNHHEADPEFLRALSIPNQVRQLFRDAELKERYAYSFHINPFYLRGDFDGDGVADYAIMVRENTGGRIGIAVCRPESDQVIVLGPEIAVEDKSEFAWIDAWQVYPKGAVSSGVDEPAPPILLCDAIFVEKAEASSGLIYWDGMSYAWYQQGD